MRSFLADYCTGVHPAVADAVYSRSLRACLHPYGEDATTKLVKMELSHHFNHSPALIYFVPTGTAANKLAMSMLLSRGGQAVMCATSAHINTFEAGAIESLGHKIIAIETSDGKLKPSDVEKCEASYGQGVHTVKPSVLSISNPTECGTVYTPNEVQALATYADDYGLKLHIDGARLPYAAEHLELSDFSSVTYGDAITLSTTKIGGARAAAVVFPNLDDEGQGRLHKQMGYLEARTDLAAVELSAMFSGDLWQKNARQANQMAQLLVDFLRKHSKQPFHPVQSNVVFMKAARRALPELNADKHVLVWDEERAIIRAVCSWNTTSEDIEELAEYLAKKLA